MSWSFHLCALITLASAVGAMSLRNLVHAALALGLCFVGMATLFLHLHAPFAAFAQILVYVGAVAILIVFAILLTRSSEREARRTVKGVMGGLTVTVLVGAGFLVCVFGSKLLKGSAHGYQATSKALGEKLMTTHVLPLEIMGLLLTAAMLGAVVIALPQDKGERLEDSK